MKPLDLQVGIQNSYEAARSESVRLEKPHAQGMVANEDAQRDQVVRDQSVVAPEPRIMQEDLFTSEEYHAPDYSEAGGSSQNKRGKKKHPPENAAAAADTETKADKAEPDLTGGKFSTYA